MDSKIGSQQQGLRVEISSSRSRQTAKTDFGTVMQTGLSRTANAVLEGGRLAAPFIPGGAVLSAAITGVGSVKSTAAGQTAIGSNANVVGSPGGAVGTVAGGPTGTTPGATTANSVDAMAAAGDSSAVLMQETQRMQELNQSFNLQYLGLQQKMQAENRQFTTLSNIMKTKHDTAKNAISNVR